MRKLVLIQLLFMVMVNTSCTIYHKASSPINYAAASNDWVKVTFKDGAVIKKAKIVYFDSAYYAAKTLLITDSYSKEMLTPINSDNVLSVRIINRTATSYLRFGIFLGILGIIIGWAVVCFWDC